MYTVASLAKFLRISDEQVLSHIRAGRIRAANVGGGTLKPRWRISEAAVAAFLESRSTTPKQAAQRKPKRTAQEVTYF
jgi:excisionase family DNA binding protein